MAAAAFVAGAFLAAAFLAVVFFAAAFFAGAFLAAVFFAGVFLAAAFLVPRLRVVGPASRRAWSSSAARSGVMPSTVSPSRSRSEALVSPSVT